MLTAGPTYLKADRQLPKRKAARLEAPNCGHSINRRQANLMPPPRLAVLAFVLLEACSATDITQSPWEPSPTGGWLTRTVRNNTSGPGNNYLAEAIQVRSVAADRPVDVLTLEEMNGPATIKLRWRDPTHLEIAYVNGEVVFQAVKVGDLSIDAIPTVHVRE
jgi:hypothetical protein